MDGGFLAGATGASNDTPGKSPGIDISNPVGQL